jgi:RNA polymerase sigma factor (sigma-70 family)
MRTSPTDSLIDHLRRAVLLPDGVGLGDDELLGRFIEGHDEAAFAVLVNRHGPMVWGVCRRLLHEHDAEDAFQATFFVLARKAASIRSKEMVGTWLYGVAHQTALQARRTAARRRVKEVQVTKMPDIEALEPGSWADIQPLLDEELSRLPEIYRAVIVLCDLEGRTRKEVASHLGMPEGTVAARMARARAMLAKRLTQRGVTLSGGIEVYELKLELRPASENDNSNGVGGPRASTLYGTGKFGVQYQRIAGPSSGNPNFQDPILSKLPTCKLEIEVKADPSVEKGKANDEPPAAKKGARAPAQPEQKQEKEAVTAWGKQAGGLQAGLGFRPGERRAYHHDETVTLVVRVRNVSKESVQLQYVKTFFVEEPPIVTDASGKQLSIDSYPIPKEVRNLVLVKLELAPGKEAEIDSMRLQLRSPDFVDEFSPIALDPTIRLGIGTFRVRYGRLAPKAIDNIGAKLSTGKLDLEIKPDPPQKEGVNKSGTASSCTCTASRS